MWYQRWVIPTRRSLMSRFCCLGFPGCTMMRKRSMRTAPNLASRGKALWCLKSYLTAGDHEMDSGLPLRSRIPSSALCKAPPQLDEICQLRRSSRRSNSETSRSRSWSSFLCSSEELELGPSRLLSVGFLGLESLRLWSALRPWS